MAKLSEALKIAFELEHGSDERALHKNPNEDGLTFCGIYEKANPHWIGWNYVKEAINKYKDIKKASIELMKDTRAINAVEVLYKGKYWDKMKGDDILSQKIANEIFIFGINVGMVNAIKTSQRVIGVSADGIFGNGTLKAINEFSEDKFDMLFDEREIVYYTAIADNKPIFKQYINGWKKRALFV